MAQTDLINEGLLADYHDELMKDHIVGGTVFDISSYHATGTPPVPVPYADLAAALGTNGANVPASMRKGGMSVKFIQGTVQSSDNHKYVQARCMAQNFTTDVTQWQGVDSEPVAGSKNLVESGGSYKAPNGIQNSFVKSFIDEFGKVSIIGDSISTFAGSIYPGYSAFYPSLDVTDVTQTWWDMLINANGATLEVNASYNGSRVTKHVTYPDFYERTSLLGTPNTIFVALGTNDSTNSVQLGDYDYDTPIADLDETKFIPAYIKGIKSLQANYPTAKIHLFAFKMRDEYYDAIANIAAHYNLPLLKVMDYSADGNHPYYAGMKTISQKFTMSLYHSKNVDSEIKSGSKNPISSEAVANSYDELIDVLPATDIINCVQKYYIIIYNSNKWIYSAGARFLIYPLKGSGTIKFARGSGEAAVFTLSNYQTPSNNAPANIVGRLTDGNSYDYNSSTDKYLYVLLYYNSDRTPASILINGYDILKSVSDNLRNGFIKDNSVSTAKIQDNSVTYNKLDNSIAFDRVAVLYSSHTDKTNLNFNFTLNKCTISRSTRIFANSKPIAGVITLDVELDLTKDYQNNTITGGVIMYDRDNYNFFIIPHTYAIFQPSWYVIATYNISSKTVNSPSSYSVDGNVYGIYVPNLAVEREICPCFDFIEMPNGISWWSDFIPITINGVDELWFFVGSSESAGGNANGKIYRVNMSTWQLINPSVQIKHNFGHCNTVHYDALHDNLIISNLGDDVESAFYIFYNISDWVNITPSNNQIVLDFATLSPSTIKVGNSVASMNFSENSAFWGNNGYDCRNEVYVMSSISTVSCKFAKIVLGMGSTELTYGTLDSNHTGASQFNGTYDILFGPVNYSNPSDNDGNKNVIQGGDYAKGRVITANGHDQIYGFIWNALEQRGEIQRTMINSVPRKPDGSIAYSVGEGLCVRDGYVYHGCIRISDNFRTGSYSVIAYGIVKYPLPY